VKAKERAARAVDALDEGPIGAKFLRRHRPLVGRVERRVAFRSGDRVGLDLKGAERNRKRRHGPHVDRALIGRAQVGAQLVRRAAVAAFDQAAKDVEDVVGLDFVGRLLGNLRPGPGHMVAEDVGCVGMAASALGSKVPDVGLEQPHQRARGALGLRHLALLERGAFLDASFAQATGMLALAMLCRSPAAVLASGGGRVAETARYQLLGRRARVEGPDGFAMRAALVREAPVERDGAIGELARLQRSTAGQLLDRQEGAVVLLVRPLADRAESIRSTRRPCQP
jgi:hypothetical protein